VAFWEKIVFWWKVGKCYEIGGKWGNFSKIYARVNKNRTILKVLFFNYFKSIIF
jgi:hypothetical protein